MEQNKTLRALIFDRLPCYKIKENEPLAKHTSFRIGGPAELMVFPSNRDELQTALRCAAEAGEKPRILGAGTNILAPDEGVRGLVVCLRDTFMGLTLLDDTHIEAMSGMTLAKTAMFAARNGLSGLEFAHGIPGTVGGAIYMNAGAYGGEIRDVAIETEFMRLDGTVERVSGAAQGFGKGIAEELYKEGATVVIADMNEPLAKQVAEEFGERAVAIAVNVYDEESVAAMVGRTVELFGGLDLMLSNAGVVRSGPIAQVEKKDFEFVTNINYTGYFLCAKYAAIIMQAQHEADPDAMFDIVTLNSKSGLEGSNKNFAYAGSKFGGIGLTQSFALELCAYNIKVNAVCPGNFLDGPLWSDPERGLFVQYLNAGKVPGAKTVADVRRFYEAKVPMNRGCLPIDVARAVMYCVEQKYETGQAIPVTGGQVMLN